MSISMKMGHLCTISIVKAEAITEAVVCSLKGTKDRFGHSLLYLSESLAFKDVISHPRFNANTITSGKFFDGARCCDCYS